MKKNRSQKIKSLLLSLIYSVSLVCTCTSSAAKENSYKNKLFFGDSSEVMDIYDPDGEYLAYIIDERNNVDPNIEIYNSYLINNPIIMRKILLMLLEYEEKNPSEWDRTYESMYNEWLIHNIFYKMNLLEQRSYSVDLNNADEEVYIDVLKSLAEGKFNSDFLQIKNNAILRLKK